MIAWGTIPHPATADERTYEGAKPGAERGVDGVKLCWCPPGKLTMVSPPSEPDRRPDEGPVAVTLSKGFWTAKYETTQGQLKLIHGKLPGQSSAELPADDDLPGSDVTFAAAEEFCVKLTPLGRKDGTLPPGWEVRLPTEAQWEYACRAGTTTATAFGDVLGTAGELQGQALQRRSGGAIAGQDGEGRSLCRQRVGPARHAREHIRVVPRLAPRDAPRRRRPRTYTHQVSNHTKPRRHGLAGPPRRFRDGDNRFGRHPERSSGSSTST